MSAADRAESYYLRYCAAMEACRELKLIRDYLHKAGARQTANKVRSALKSADGAARNAWEKYQRHKCAVADGGGF